MQLNLNGRIIVPSLPRFDDSNKLSQSKEWINCLLTTDVYCQYYLLLNYNTWGACQVQKLQKLIEFINHMRY